MKPRLTFEADNTRLSSRWQLRQRSVCSRLSLSLSVPAATGLRWQVRQFGASARPAAKAAPCAEFMKCSVTSEWHSPQAATSFGPAKDDLGPDASSIPWVPWHEVQSVSAVATKGVAAKSAWNAWVLAVPSWHPLQSTAAAGLWCGRRLRSMPSWQSVHPRVAWAERANPLVSTWSDTAFPSRQTESRAFPWQARQAWSEPVSAARTAPASTAAASPVPAIRSRELRWNERRITSGAARASRHPQCCPKPEISAARILA